jgi:sugar/nucleoside kinase (ribokinase family)
MTDGGRLLHVGNAVIDVVLTVPALPGRGGDALASAAAVLPGGGFNVMLAAARQGMPVAYAGTHGTGPFGDRLRAALREAGIAVLLPPRPDTDTGFVVTVVDAGGERTFLTGPGTLVTPSAADLAAVAAAPGDVVSVSGYGLLPAAEHAALTGWLAALPAGAAVVFDPGPLVADIPPAPLAAVLDRADWVTLNAAEATRLTGHADPAGAAAALARRGRPGAVVRTGADGCVVAPPGRPAVRVPGFAVTPVDTTGAGDTHTGTFAAAVARGEAPAAAARLANAAAALSVTVPGPATAPAAADLAAFLRARG